MLARDKNINEITQKLSHLDCEIISLKRQNNRLIEENEQLINQLTDFEAKTTEFNNIGLQQQEQLHILEDNVRKGGSIYVYYIQVKYYTPNVNN